MRALIQRVTRASVVVEDKTVSRIGCGFLIFLGICRDDTAADADALAEKIPNLRVFDDAQGKMNVAALEAAAEFLVVSQFTLYGDCRKGRRPGFDRAAPADQARPLYEEFLKSLSAKCGKDGGEKVKSGVFGAAMKIQLENDGPVTLWMDTRE